MAEAKGFSPTLAVYLISIIKYETLFPKLSSVLSCSSSRPEFSFRGAAAQFLIFFFFDSRVGSRLTKDFDFAVLLPL